MIKEIHMMPVSEIANHSLIPEITNIIIIALMTKLSAVTAMMDMKVNNTVDDKDVIAVIAVIVIVKTIIVIETVVVLVTAIAVNVINVIAVNVMAKTTIVVETVAA
jgi:hypothetical protein